MPGAYEDLEMGMPPAQVWMFLLMDRTAIGGQSWLFLNLSGRLVGEGGIVRRNDLAFVGDSEVNRSVSREHIHIEYDKTTGEYRLFNDRWLLYCWFG
jgi:hypothetical protein